MDDEKLFCECLKFSIFYFLFFIFVAEVFKFYPHGVTFFTGITFFFFRNSSFLVIEILPATFGSVHFK